MKIVSTSCILFAGAALLVASAQEPTLVGKGLSADARIKAVEAISARFLPIYQPPPFESIVDGEVLLLQRKRLDVRRLETQGEAKGLADAILLFPEIHWLDLSKAEVVSPSLVQAISELPHLRVLDLPRRGKQRLRLDGKFFKALANAPELQSLSLGTCSASEEAFRELVAIQNLQLIEMHAALSPRLLITVSKMPHLRGLSVNSSPGGAPSLFRKPLDPETERSIARLNGRPIMFTSDAMVDISLFRALSQVKTLKNLYIGDAGGVSGAMTPEDALLYAKHDRLEQFSVSWSSPRDKRSAALSHQILAEVSSKASKRSRDLRKAARDNQAAEL